MSNPYSLLFGKTPAEQITRISQTNEILNDFLSDSPVSQVYMLTGIRGCGKTVMMTELSNRIRTDDHWIVIELNPERDMLHSFAAALYSIPAFHKLFLKAKLDFSVLGIGVSLEGAAPVSDVEVALDKMLSCLKKTGKKILLTVDEVTNNEHLRVLAASYQILIRKEYPLYLLMTGLYENIYQLQNEKSLTFLYRAPKIHLDPLNYTAVLTHYKKMFSLSDEQAAQMADLTKGYSYAFQVLGYLMWEHQAQPLEDILPEYDQYLEEYVYDKIWSELSANDKKVILAMASGKETNVTKLRTSLNMTTSEFSVYRDRLKKKGLISVPQYGMISLLLPRFEEYALRKGA